jgi:hypothetical protein
MSKCGLHVGQRTLIEDRGRGKCGVCRVNGAVFESLHRRGGRRINPRKCWREIFGDAITEEVLSFMAGFQGMRQIGGLSDLGSRLGQGTSRSSCSRGSRLPAESGDFIARCIAICQNL